MAIKRPNGYRFTARRKNLLARLRSMPIRVFHGYLRQVALLVAEGKRNHEIAKLLGLARSTVNPYVCRVFRIVKEYRKPTPYRT